ncbi:hypothetical protein ACOSP7_008326 [Xanthoceras sorbifolium]
MEPRFVLKTPLREAGARKLALCLVGKILTTKLINREAFRAIIPKIWRTTQTFIMENVKENVFVFQFQNQADKRRVLTGGPWSFDKCLIVLEEPLGDGKFLEMGFNNVPFWVQLHNVPLVCMTKEIGWALGNKIGQVTDIDVGATGDCLGRFLRVRVVIDVSKPLSRYLRMCLSEGDPDTVLLLRYERLTEYCFQCGVVGHVVRECQLAHDSSGSSSVPEFKFGTWMRAESPPKARYPQTVNDGSSEIFKQKQGSVVLCSPGLEALEKSGVSNHSELAHATIASKKTTPTNLVAGSTVPTLSSQAYSSSTIAVLTGAVLSRKTVGLKKNSDLHGPVKATTKNSALKEPVSESSMHRGLKDPAKEPTKNSASGSGCARDDGMVGGVMGVVQGEETDPDDLGVGGAAATLGMGAAELVDHEEGHVHAGLAAGGSAAHVLGGQPLVTSGLALAQAHAGHVGASLVRPCMTSCMAPFDDLGSVGHVTLKLAVELVIPCVDHVLSSADHVLPCMAFERAHPVQCVVTPEEEAAASFIFSAHVGESTTVVSPPSMAAMEVDRKHFKWKRFLWGLNIPAKVRMFVWRTCRNLLPTRSLLAARRVPVGAGCPLCNVAVESVLHSLWLCRSLAESKAAIPFLASLHLPAAGSFLDFILACFSILIVHEMELLLVLLWQFWFRRNLAVHSISLLSVEDTVGWSERFLVDFQAAVAVPSVRCDLVVERWLAPSPGWVKINSDVAVDVRGRRLGFGVVIRDCTGKVLVSYTSLLLGLFSSDIGEALAILLGLRLAIDMGLSTVCVESDAASVVKQLSSQVSSCSDIGLILDDILSLVVNFAALSFSSVRRSANIVAHSLAKFVLSHQPVGVRLGSVPSSLARVVLDDSHGRP